MVVIALSSGLSEQLALFARRKYVHLVERRRVTFQRVSEREQVPAKAYQRVHSRVAAVIFLRTSSEQGRIGSVC